jgi:hypothetical protein
VSLVVREPERRRHQFLISFEQPHAAGSFKIDTAFPSVAGVQRETGETAVEGTGTIEVIASGDDTMRRIDVRETHTALRALARQPILAAFRYQRRPNDARLMTLDVKRFADAPVIAALAEQATATTLVTSEGRMLTEISLRVRNRAQPFMKVTLPPGATMLSVEVAGETAKPVQGTDGTRVPLLRSGLRPNAPYQVSFVYLHSGQKFAKRGESQMMLPKLDLPVSVLEWELFLPDRYSTKPVAGNVLPAALAPATVGHTGALTESVTVMAEAPYSDQRNSEHAAEPKSLDAIQQSPSQNVINLQRRVAGVRRSGSTCRAPGRCTGSCARWCWRRKRR